MNGPIDALMNGTTPMTSSALWISIHKKQPFSKMITQNFVVPGALMVFWSKERSVTSQSGWFDPDLQEVTRI